MEKKINPNSNRTKKNNEKETPAVKRRQTDKIKMRRVRRRRRWNKVEEEGTGFFFREFVCLVVKQKVHSSGNTVLPTKSNNRKQSDSK